MLKEGPFHASVHRVVLDGPEPVETIVAVPDDGATVGIIQAVDIIGLRPVYDDLCLGLASHGYAVCAVEPFARIPPEVRDPLDIMARRELVRDLDDADQVGDLRRAGDYLRDVHGVSDLIVFGFCLGGYYVLKAAATGIYVGAVTCYGMITTPEEWKADGHADPMDTIDDVCPTLAAFGGKDHWTPEDQIDRLRTAWTDRPDCSVVVFDEADHGFVHSPASPSYRAEDATAFWDVCLEFMSGLVTPGSSPSG